MPSPRASLQLLASMVVVSATLGLLLVASRSQTLAPLGALPELGKLVTVLLCGAAIALHRPPGGARLGMGTLILPPAIGLFGALPAAWLAALALLLAEATHRAVETRSQFGLRDRRRTLRIVEQAAIASAAVLAAGWVWQRSGPALWTASATACATYLGGSLLLDLANRKLRRPHQRLRLPAAVLPLGPEAIGWLVGTALLLAAMRGGWQIAAALLVAVAALALEAARHAFRRDALERQIADLQRLRHAGQRMISGTSEMARVADQIRIECLNVIPFSWFHFALLEGDSQSWRAGPDGCLEEGQPRPGGSPRPLPGIHRRASWKLIERELRAEGRPLACLRLWCDPCRLEPHSLELLEMLVPQMAASVQRVILDREAKQDDLTGIAVRRVLEGRLQEAYRRCYEEGGSIAVILCDLDRFKRINDTYGHRAGDQALIQVARLLETHGRDSDLCCRYGGEEFAVLLEGTDGATALQIADRLRDQVAQCRFVFEGEHIPLTLSAGVAAFPEVYITTATELFLLADGALYAAKRNGRNRSLLHVGRGRYGDPAGNLVAEETRKAVRQ